ncbi:MAG TPA: hypothetical protein ENJ95_13505 [Bacteroidetes bacterium]|nr:hypothetical protein [Bacteroidota bacterium]
MRRRGKKFDYAEGKYYFTIKTSPNNITMSRNTKEEAHQVFIQYFQLGKTMEWLGRWGGKKFAETTPPIKKEASK